MTGIPSMRSSKFSKLADGEHFRHRLVLKGHEPLLTRNWQKNLSNDGETIGYDA